MEMSALTEDKLERKAGKRFRLVVRSAEEAVRVIREKLGEDARVLSVKQVGGEGLKRFISSPKLEVIAEIPSPEQKDFDEANALDEESAQPASGSVGAEAIDGGISQTEPSSAQTQVDQPEAGSEQLGLESIGETERILSKAGFDPHLLSEIQSWANWKSILELPFADALKEITIGLSDRFRATSAIETTDRVALLGAPGVGKTTTLCKFLAHEVFMNKRTPHVLKVENGIPNPDDALRIFCEVIGVTLFREPSNLPAISDSSPLYLDFPGLSLSHMDDWVETKETLDHLEVQTRVLVLNGAYDRQVLLKNISSGKHLGATHVAFTHFDELSNSTKLWPIILRSGLSPLCICNGQNVTGDFTTSVLNQMIAKTFPEELYSRGFASYRRN
jgi:flagellar biosynthesis protein FlhF